MRTCVVVTQILLYVFFFCYEILILFTVNNNNIHTHTQGIDTDQYLNYQFYPWAAYNTKDVGNMIGYGLKEFLKKYSVENIHLIGNCFNFNTFFPLLSIIHI